MQKARPLSGKNVHTREFFGGTVAPNFNILGPSGRQSLTKLRTFSHTGRISLEASKANGQFSIDTFKSLSKHAAERAFKEALKDKAKDEAKNAVLDIRNYLHVRVQAMGGALRYNKWKTVHVGGFHQFEAPDHEEMIISIRVDPVFPILWRLVVEGTGSVRRY